MNNQRYVEIRNPIPGSSTPLERISTAIYQQLLREKLSGSAFAHSELDEAFLEPIAERAVQMAAPLAKRLSRRGRGKVAAEAAES